MNKVIKFLDRHFLIVCILILVLLYFATGLRLCSVESGSMEPTIPTGSLCIVSTRVDYEDIELGDVVVYVRASDGKRIIHRVIEITDDGMVTKGDANSRDDGLSVTKEWDNLFAKNLFHIPYLGKLPSLVRTPVGIGVVAVIAALLIFTEVKGDKKEDELPENKE